MVLKGFKVVRQTDAGYESATDCGEVVSYKVGKRTYPPISRVGVRCGPLALFGVLKNAENFVSELSAVPEKPNFAVFKCKYRQYTGTRIELWDSMFSLQEKLFPEGTLLADWIELIEGEANV